MRKKSLINLALIFALMALGISCKQSPPLAPQSISITPTPTHLRTSTPFITPTATYLPITPAWSGTQAPNSETVISTENFDRLALFARWGNGNTSHVQYSSNGEYIIVAYSTGVYFYNAQDYSIAKQIDLGTYIKKLAVAPNDKTMAVATYDKVYIFDKESNKPTKIIKEMITSLAFSPNGQTLALGTYKYNNGRYDKFGNIQLWDVTSGIKALEIENDRDWINSIAFSKNGEFLATAGYSTQIWSIDGILLDRQGNYVSGGNTNDLAFSPDGMLLAEGADSEDGLHIWRVQSNGKLTISKNIPTHGNRIAISPDGNWLVADSTYGLSIWALRTGLLKQQLSDSHTIYNNLSWSPDSKHIVASSDDLGVEVWDSETGLLLKNLNPVTGSITSLDWLPNGKTIVRGTDNGDISLIDSASGNLLQTFVGDAFENSFAVSPDGEWLAIKSYVFSDLNGDIEIINLKDSNIRHRLPNSNQDGLISDSFSQDGNYLVTSGYEGSKIIIQVWNTEDWSLYNSWVLGEITEKVYPRSLVFNPDNQFVTVSTRKAMEVFQISDGTVRQTIKTSPNSVILSPDGQHLLTTLEELDSSSGSSTQTLSVWNINDGRLVFTIENLGNHKMIPPAPPYYHNLTNITDWSPNGELIAIGFTDGTIGILNASNGQLLQTLTGHTMRVTAVAFSPDGTSLASGSLDGTIRLWSVK
jgi:WD40 repeat protein